MLEAYVDKYSSKFFLCIQYNFVKQKHLLMQRATNNIMDLHNILVQSY